MYRRDRAYRRGGGVLIAVCNKIRSKLMTNHSDAEIISIELCISPKKLYLSCVYVPPNSSNIFNNHVFRHISSQSSHADREVHIVGDFNAPDINWLTYNASSLSSQTLCSCLSDNNLQQIVSKSTHKQGGNTLDLIITNILSRFTNVYVDHTSESPSDHYLVSLRLSQSLPDLDTSRNKNCIYNYV